MPRIFQAIESVIKELVSALLEADVNVKLVASLRTKIRARVSQETHLTMNPGAHTVRIRLRRV